MVASRRIHHFQS